MIATYRHLVPKLALTGILLTVSIQATAQEKATELVEKGNLMLAQANYAEARTLFNDAAKASSENIAALVGIARTSYLEGRLEQGGREIEKALAIDPNDVAARYVKAMCHREISKHDVLNAPRNRRIAVGLFEEIIAEDSLYEDVLFEYGLLKRYINEYEQALNMAHRQLALKPHSVRAQLGIHQTYRHLLAFEPTERVDAWLARAPQPYALLLEGERHREAGRLNAAEELFRRVLELESDIPPQPIHLALARVYYQRNQPEKAQVLLDAAVDDVGSEVDAAFLFEDFKYVLSDEELALYRELRSPAERQIFFRAMWEQRDPMPAREVNTRLAEHYRRMLFAEREYRYLGIRSWHNDPDKAGNLSIPRVALINEEFNDKGLIFIRHGEPIDKVTAVGGDPNFFRTQISGIESANWLPSERSYNTDYAFNESWRYRNPDMDFHFVVESNEENNWRLIPILSSYSMLESREYWGDPYASMVRALRAMQQQNEDPLENFTFDAELEDGNTEFDSVDTGTNASISTRSITQQPIRFELELEEARQMMIQHSRESVLLGLNTDRQTWDEEVEPMPIPHMIAAFRGEDGMTELDLYYALPIGAISEKYEGESKRIDVETGYALHDAEWNVVAQLAEVKRLPRNDEKTAAIVDFHRVVVAPDSYQVALHGYPPESQLLGGYKFGYRVPDFTVESLSMSDLLLAHNIMPTTTLKESRFERNGYKITSNPFQRYSVDQTVYIYFEIYRLALNSDDMTEYQIEYILTPEKQRKVRLFRRGDRPILSLKVERSGLQPSPVEYAEFDVSKVDPGKYIMTIRVTDLLTGSSAESDRAFELTR